MHYTDGPRYICLDCVPPGHAFAPRTVALCAHPLCLAAAFGREVVADDGAEETIVHVPTHDLVKVRTMVHRVLWPMLVGEARAALWFARESDLKLAMRLVDSRPEPDVASADGFSRPGTVVVILPMEEPSSEDNADGHMLAETAEERDAACTLETVRLQEGAHNMDERTPDVCEICHKFVYLGECWRCLTCQGYSIFLLHLRR